MPGANNESLVIIHQEWVGEDKSLEVNNGVN